MKALSVLLLCALPVTAQAAAFLLDCEVSTVDLDNSQVLFSMTFNHAPDFFTTDGIGRQRHGFQYYLHVDPLSAPDTEELVLLRSRDIPATGMIGISDNYAPSRDLLSYILTDNTVTFSSPISLLGDDDGSFMYSVLLTEYGSSTVYTSWHESGAEWPSTIPAPGALVLAAVGAGCVTWLRRRRTL